MLKIILITAISYLNAHYLYTDINLYNTLDYNKTQISTSPGFQIGYSHLIHKNDVSPYSFYVGASHSIITTNFSNTSIYSSSSYNNIIDTNQFYCNNSLLIKLQYYVFFYTK